MGRSVWAAALLIGAAMVTAVPASALEIGDIRDGMREGRYAASPFGFQQFCRRGEALCNVYRQARRTSPSTVSINGVLARQLDDVNRRINRQITAIPEFSFWSRKDDWKIPSTTGDCEDFALLKQQRLIELGWPESSLLIAVVDTAAGDRHAVLVVRTDHGDLVLDNNTNEIRHWRDTGFTWLMRQSARNMMQWVRIVEESENRT